MNINIIYSHLKIIHLKIIPQIVFFKSPPKHMSLLISERETERERDTDVRESIHQLPPTCAPTGIKPKPFGARGNAPTN